MDSPPSVFVERLRGGRLRLPRRRDRHRADELGEGFLADVCRAWEEAARAGRAPPASAWSPRASASSSARPAERSPRCSRRSRPAPATRLGSGDQYWAWVELDDVLARDRVGAPRRGARGRGQRHRAGAGDQPGVHQDAGARAAPPGRAGGAVLLPASRPRRDGRRDAAREPAGACPRGSRSAASASPSPRSRARCATSSGAADRRGPWAPGTPRRDSSRTSAY